MFSKRWLLFTLLIIVVTLLAACDTADNGLTLPDYVRLSPHTVQVAYQFAVEHPDMLTHQPCYCGCGPMGHENVLDCFVAAVNDQGAILFDSHAAGCGICVDIALDVKRLSEQGLSQLDIRYYIDATYSVFGPPTDTLMPQS